MISSSLKASRFTFAGASFAALANCLPGRTHDDYYRGSTASRGNPNRFRIGTLQVSFDDFGVAELTLTAGLAGRLVADLPAGGGHEGTGVSSMGSSLSANSNQHPTR